VEGFRLQTHEVTNGQFAKFVGATGYQTDAELSSTSRDPGGGSAIFDMDTAGWRLVRGATWRTPSGPGSNIKGADDLPVIHVSHRDAAAYAAWSGGRLPREIEFEYAASLNLPDPTNQLSGTFDPAGRPVANTWQGFFPVRDEATDGFRGLAPVGCFPPGKLGAFDLIGNVWEWTDTAFQAGPQFTIKGGSFLCARNFCGRFRPAARQSEDADFSTNHIGFRVVKSALPSQKAAS
jgi:sulfatase modifying factor 1